MVTKNYFLFIVLITSLLFGAQVHAQVRVGANLGLMNYYGDASDATAFSFPLSSTGLSGGVFAEKSINRYFIPQVQLFYGKISATKDYLDVQAKGNILDLSLKLQLDLMELIKEDAKLQLAPHLGGVVGFYNSEVTRTSTGVLIDAGHINNQTGYRPALGFAFGARIGYEITKSWTVMGSLDARSFFTDAVDDYRGLSSAAGLAGKDWTCYLNAGLSYTLNKKEEDRYEEPTPLIAEKNKDGELNGLFTYNNLPKQGAQVNLFDANNTKLASTITDINGKFKFEDLNPQENYVVRLGEEDKSMFNSGKVYVLNDFGKRVLAADKPGFNAYTFTKLTDEQTQALPILVEDRPMTAMNGAFVYDELPRGGVKLYLMDEDENILDSTITRTDGTFSFSKLDPNVNYLVHLDEKDAADFPDASVFFTNANGEPVMRGAKAPNGYLFKALDKNELAELQVLTKADGNLMYRKVSAEDPKTDEPIIIAKGDTSKTKASSDNSGAASGNLTFESETIYFKHNSFWVSQNQQGTKGSIIAKKLKANPQMRIRIEGWASQVGDENYNLSLSQKRADALKELLVNTYGIAPDRIEAVGRGEVLDSKATEEDSRRAGIIVIQ